MIVDPAVRFPSEYAQWQQAGGVPNVDFLAWLAVTRGYKLSIEEYKAIAEATKGNVDALLLLPEPPKAV